jgi:hypothetical protein
MNFNDILQKPWVIPTAVGVTGLGVGFGVGFFTGKKQQLRELQQQIIDDTEEYLDTLDSGINVDELPQPEIDEEVADPVADMEEILDEEVETEVEVNVHRNVFEGVEGDQWVWEDEQAHRAEHPSEPYVIHRDEFMNNENDYQQETLTYYKGDDIVAGEDDTPIYNHSALIGDLKFGHGSGDAGVVYIRNDVIHMEWEVILHEGSFEVEVNGLVVEEKYEAEDIKHAHERRFRPD